jgi:histone-lysine N-methyltransferase SETD3
VHVQIGKKIMEANLELDAPKHVFIMLYMLLDRRRPDSFFKPYYDILPQTLSNMPIFWSEEELEMLAGSYLLTQIDERNDAIAKDYHEICLLDASFPQMCTLDEFKWARMCVSSRNFGMQINGLRTAAMVPFADMLNHYRPRETKWQFEDMTQSFTVVSLQDIAAGAQVYDSYGQKCNHRFLLNYGFSVESNIEPDGFCPNEVCLHV